MVQLAMFHYDDDLPRYAACNFGPHATVAAYPSIAKISMSQPAVARDLKFGDHRLLVFINCEL